MSREPKIGDKILVPNLGGGSITRFDNSQIYVLLDEFGFEVPIIKDVIIFLNDQEILVETGKEVIQSKPQESQSLVDQVSSEPPSNPQTSNMYLIKNAMRFIE